MTAFKFAYSTNAYTKFSLADAVADIKRIGFEGVEILADTPHAFPFGMSPDDAGRLRAAVESAGLAVSNLNGNTSMGLDKDGRDPDGFWPGLLEPHEKARRLRIDHVMRVIDLARVLGADCICTASGRLPRGMPEERAWKLMTGAIEEILSRAEEAPVVRVGIEFEPGLFIGNLGSMLRLLETLDHPLLGANLDVGHAVCAGDDPAAAVEALRGRIWNLHIEDIRGRKHRHLIPGEGDIDFRSLRRALEQTGYDRFLTLELYPYKENPGEAGEKGFQYIRSVFS